MKLPKLPLNLTGLSSGLTRVFSFSRREAAIIIISVSAVLAAALIITVIAVTVSGKSTVSLRTKKITADAPDVGSNIVDRPFLSDFIIYEDSLEESFTGVIYSREPSKKWSSEKVEEYWIDPREIAADQLEKEAEKLIRDIFADVP